MMVREAYAALHAAKIMFSFFERKENEKHTEDCIIFPKGIITAS